MNFWKGGGGGGRSQSEKNRCRILEFPEKTELLQNLLTNFHMQFAMSVFHKYSPVATTGFWRFMPRSKWKYNGIQLFPCINHRAIGYCPVVATGHVSLQGNTTVQCTHCAMDGAVERIRCLCTWRPLNPISLVDRELEFSPVAMFSLFIAVNNSIHLW